MIAIVDYQAGNLPSVKRALQQIGVKAIVTRNSSQILSADKVIFPGVGAAGTAMSFLKKIGLASTLRSFVKKKGKGFLGICLGCQIILNFSEENNTNCLKILPGQTKLLPAKENLKIPHMGWNQVKQKKSHSLFRNIPDKTNFYFIHSYYPEVSQEYTLGVTDYSISFPSVIGKDNVLAVQFHVEKSGQAGLQLLSNFVSMKF